MDMAIDSSLDDHVVGRDIPDPQTIRPDHEGAIDVPVPLNPSMHNVIGGPTKVADVHGIASEDDRKLFKLIETAASGHISREETA